MQLLIYQMFHHILFKFKKLKCFIIFNFLILFIMLDIEFLFLIIIIFEYIVIKTEEKNYYLIAFFNLINGLFIAQYYEEIHIIFAIFGLLFILLKSAFQLFALREYFNKE